MKKFTVEIIETNTVIVNVEAEDAAEAASLAEEEYLDNPGTPDYSFTDYEVMGAQETA